MTFDEAAGHSWFLRSARLGFRTWESGDLELAVGLWGDERVTRLIDSRGRLTVEQVREKLEEAIQSQRREGVQYWPMFLLEGGAHVGCCGLKPYAEESGVYELGFHLRPEQWGRGLAREAARAVIAHGFDVVGARALMAGHAPENEPSKRILLDLGFVYRHHALYPPTGREHPWYRLVREER